MFNKSTSLNEFLAKCQVELNNCNECIVFEVCIRNKKGCIILLYRSPSQTHDEFDNFFLTLEQVLCDIIARNSLFDLVTRGCNARTANWWRNNMTTTEVTKIDSLTTSNGFIHIICSPIMFFQILRALTLFLQTKLT